MSQSGYNGNSRAVMVVDDNVFNVQTLKTLINMKFKIDDIETELDGKLALDRVKYTLRECRQGEMPFKVIFMDIHMPNMNGFDSSQNILTLCRKALSSPPYIVALTAHVNEEVKKRCNSIGIKEVIQKPITVNELGRILRLVELI